MTWDRHEPWGQTNGGKFVDQPLICCYILVGTPEMNRPLEKRRRRWRDNIKMKLKYLKCDGVLWIYLAQVMIQWRALVNTVMNLWDP
jgi:hypothetical protein